MQERLFFRRPLVITFTCLLYSSVLQFIKKWKTSFLNALALSVSGSNTLAPLTTHKGLKRSMARPHICTQLWYLPVKAKIRSLSCTSACCSSSQMWETKETLRLLNRHIYFKINSPRLPIFNLWSNNKKTIYSQLPDLPSTDPDFAH